MELRILPGNIANMIAAGEVVQRPASVVKELMENAVDAGADRISVTITDAGRTLIQVIDNGKGMDPDEAVLCFERHATSKIASAEDLDGILTYGFRGEALPSIAAVAEVTLKTRTEDRELGCEVEFAASEHLSTRETMAPKGTSVAVRNLFYNVPARRKFLKSDNVEFKHIVEEFTKVALTRPAIGFSLSHNGKDVFVLKPAKSMKFRIMDLLGTSLAEDLVDVSSDTSVVSIRGYVGRPDAARKTPGNQYFFVNGRYFRSPYLHKAVMKAYEGFVQEGAVPAYFIFLDVDPGTVDVNISPTKSEVKFEDDSFIFQVLFASVREVLGKNSFAGSIDFSNPEANGMPVLGSHFSDYRPDTAPRVQLDEGYNPFEFEAAPATEGQAAGRQEPPAFGGKYVDRSMDYGKLFEDNSLPVSQTIVIGGRYIVTPAKDGLMVVDSRRARERILYDRALAALSRNMHVTQTAMFPVKVEVGVENRTLFDDKAALLSSLGFDISPFGTDTVVVNGVPEGFSAEPGKVQAMVGDLLLILSDDSSSLPGVMESSLAEKFALLGASSAAGVTSPAEARRIVDALLSCDNPEITAKGRKIMAVMPLSALEKLF
ncbi:MAG: DNA mismatch repair endonuclease MutL [Bacteroidales bacterium]|jgi:DNA mismatch repair protein MutL|nr:DNA mismatch repair endonuclease MutL [Bacteroidales bacterium]